VFQRSAGPAETPAIIPEWTDADEAPSPDDGRTLAGCVPCPDGPKLIGATYQLVLSACAVHRDSTPDRRSAGL
jgi:hypothetical protein